MARQRDIGSIFSDVWYRVAEITPRVSPHAHFIRQEYGGQVTYIVEEPASGRYYRLTEPAYFFIALLDGDRNVGEAWDACNAQLGDGAPTQRECVELLAQLQLFGLLLGDLPIEADMVLERISEKRRRRRDRRTGKWMFPNIPLFNPAKFLERLLPLWNALFSKPAFIAWLLLVGVAIVLVAINRKDLAASFQLGRLLSPAGLAILSISFLVLRLVHEIGHAAACRRFGGPVTEIGLILIAYVLPIPYCDATSSWRFPSLTKRVIVALAGIYFETVIAAVAAIIWAVTDPTAAPTLRTVAYAVMILSGITTIVFNLNPLLRYDGYYVLSDVAGSPNLSTRSREMWKHAAIGKLFGVRSSQPPATRDRAETSLLWIFGALSTPYRLLIMVAIILVIISQYPGIGLLIAIVVLSMWVAWPLIKGATFLIGSPTLIGRRLRAITTVLAVGAVVAIVVGVIPTPAAAYATGIIEPQQRMAVRNNEEGFLVEVLVREGDRVRVGDPVARLDNPMAQRDRRVASARVDRARAELEIAINNPAQHNVIAQELQAAQAELARVRQRIDNLTITAPLAGRIVIAGNTTHALNNHTGQYLARGTLLAEVISDEKPVVRVAMSDREYANAFKQTSADDTKGEANVRRVSVRVRGAAGTSVPAEISSIVPRASRELLTESLATTAGGEITPDPTDPTQTLTPHVLIEVTPSTAVEWPAGLRARIRFGLPPESLADQWTRRARQFFKARLG